MSARLLGVLSLTLAACGPPGPDTPPRAPPSAAQLTLECDARSVFAWAADRTFSPGNRVRCVAHVGDRLGAPLSGVRVSLLTEAGSLTVAEGVTDGGVLETELVVGLPEPINVPPGVFSFGSDGGSLVPTWMAPRSWTANPAVPTALLPMTEPRRADPLRPDAGLDNNPRDHLVTLIAVVDGEEAFDDDNANAFRDPREAFVDLPEPFVDADDDGTRGASELFVDGNANGVWDGKNASWDSAARVSAATHVLWTGLPAAADVSGATPRPTVGTNLMNPLRFSCPSSPCSAAPSQLAIVSIADPWFNGISRTRATDGCRILPVDPRITATMAFGPQVISPETTAPSTFGIEVQDARIAPGPASVTVQLRCDFTDHAGTTRGFEFAGVHVELF